MPAEPGQTWNGSLYAKVSKVPGGGAATAQVKMTFLDAKGKKLLTRESAKLTSIGDTYTELTVQGTAPDGTAVVRMTPVVSLGGETGTIAAYYDDVRLESGDTVFETGFESGAVR